MRVIEPFTSRSLGQGTIEIRHHLECRALGWEGLEARDGLMIALHHDVLPARGQPVQNLSQVAGEFGGSDRLHAQRISKI